MKNLIYVLALALIAGSCSSGKKNEKRERAANNMAMVQKFYDEVFNAHNPALIDSLCHPDMVDHQRDPRYPEGNEGLKASFNDFFAGYPDVHVKSNWMIAKGDTVVVHFTMTGTNSGTMMGMPPTNKQINVDGVDIVVMKDGKATEHWGYMEESKMFTQLGLMPEPGAAPDTTASGSQPK